MMMLAVPAEMQQDANTRALEDLPAGLSLQEPMAAMTRGGGGHHFQPVHQSCCKWWPKFVDWIAQGLQFNQGLSGENLNRFRQSFNKHYCPTNKYGGHKTCQAACGPKPAQRLSFEHGGPFLTFPQHEFCLRKCHVWIGWYKKCLNKHCCWRWKSECRKQFGHHNGNCNVQCPFWGHNQCYNQCRRFGNKKGKCNKHCRKYQSCSQYGNWSRRLGLAQSFIGDVVEPVELRKLSDGEVAQKPSGTAEFVQEADEELDEQEDGEIAAQVFDEEISDDDSAFEEQDALEKQDESAPDSDDGANYENAIVV